MGTREGRTSETAGEISSARRRAQSRTLSKNRARPHVVKIPVMPKNLLRHRYNPKNKRMAIDKPIALNNPTIAPPNSRATVLSPAAAHKSERGQREHIEKIFGSHCRARGTVLSA